MWDHHCDQSSSLPCTSLPDTFKLSLSISRFVVAAATMIQTFGVVRMKKCAMLGRISKSCWPCNIVIACDTPVTFGFGLLLPVNPGVSTYHRIHQFSNLRSSRTGSRRIRTRYDRIMYSKSSSTFTITSMVRGLHSSVIWQTSVIVMGVNNFYEAVEECEIVHVMPSH